MLSSPNALLILRLCLIIEYFTLFFCLGIIFGGHSYISGKNTACVSCKPFFHDGKCQAVEAERLLRWPLTSLSPGLSPCQCVICLVSAMLGPLPHCIMQADPAHPVTPPGSTPLEMGFAPLSLRHGRGDVITPENTSNSAVGSVTLWATFTPPGLCHEDLL